MNSPALQAWITHGNGPPDGRGRWACGCKLIDNRSRVELCAEGVKLQADYRAAERENQAFIDSQKDISWMG